MRRSGFFALGFLALTGTLFAQTKVEPTKASSAPVAAPSAPSESSSRLPVKRVVLYKNGVGDLTAQHDAADTEPERMIQEVNVDESF